jgi:hypothetical protein
LRLSGDGQGGQWKRQGQRYGQKQGGTARRWLHCDFSRCQASTVNTDKCHLPEERFSWLWFLVVVGG